VGESGKDSAAIQRFGLNQAAWTADENQNPIITVWMVIEEGIAMPAAKKIRALSKNTVPGVTTV
jgi:hypothetical protein